MMNTSNNEERMLKAFAKKIENEKKKLVRKAKKSGFYENFGLEEIRDLNWQHYEFKKERTDMERQITAMCLAKMIDDFEKWAINLDLQALRDL